jgi:hypothetical protein
MHNGLEQMTNGERRARPANPVGLPAYREGGIPHPFGHAYSAQRCMAMQGLCSLAGVWFGWSASGFAGRMAFGAGFLRVAWVAEPLEVPGLVWSVPVDVVDFGGGCAVAGHAYRVASEDAGAELRPIGWEPGPSCARVPGHLPL